MANKFAGKKRQVIVRFGKSASKPISLIEFLNPDEGPGTGTETE
jgi:hypothetical protein